MSRSPHPHGGRSNGREIHTITDHDCLYGRGVSIAQHPGNERFRALVKTRYDESYCSTFSTSEKRAIAQEIIDHIRSLDPPGRFLKRSGKSQNSRSLMGPWEEAAPKEVLKKTCQALRDCNRTDRTGYAESVSAPEDVIQNAERRSKSGLTLKQYAQAAVARSTPASSYKNRMYQDTSRDGTGRTALLDSEERPSQRQDGVDQRKLSPSEMNADWLKRPDLINSLPRHGVAHCSPHGTVERSYKGGSVRALQPPPALSTFHSTPMALPHVGSIPVTNTPAHPSMYYNSFNGQHRALPGPLQQPPPMPPPPSPAMFYHGHSHYHAQLRANSEEEAHARIVSIPAPYSPVVYHRDKANVDIDESSEPLPAWKEGTDADQDRQNEEDLQSAAAAAELMDNDHSRSNFDLLDTEDLPQVEGSLNIDDLE